MRIVLILIFSSLSFSAFTQNHWMRIELDAKKMLNPSCNLNEGDVEENKVYLHLGLCTCLENEPYGPAHRDCSNDQLNKVFCTTQITPYQSRVWQHVVGNWGSQALDDGIGLMNYEGDSIWSIEFLVQDYFSSLSQENDSSISFTDNLTPYTLGIVFRNKDGFFSGRDNGCNDIFITGLEDYDPQVIQSMDLSNYSAVTVTMKNEANSVNENLKNSFKLFPNPSNSKYVKIKFNKAIHHKTQIEIYNSFGQLISLQNEINNDELDLSQLNTGIYFIKLSSSQVQEVKKLILQ